MIPHPYIRYAHALICLEYNLQVDIPIGSIPPKIFLKELEKGLNHFRVKARSFKGMDEVDYDFIHLEKGDTNNGIFLGGNIICTDKASANFYNSCKKVINELNKEDEDVNKYLLKQEEAFPSNNKVAIQEKNLHFLPPYMPSSLY